MMRSCRLSLNGLISLTLLFCLTVPAAADDAIRFNRDVRPILSDNCFACHGPDEKHREAEFRLDMAEQAVAVRDSGQGIVPGKPEESLVWQRIVTADDSLLMPPADFHKKLTEDQKQILYKWIQQGAEFEGHWAFQPPQAEPIPASAYENPIDAFVDQARHAQGLERSPEADRRTLIRRVTLDLTGLPPTLEEVNAFLNDHSANAYEKLVEKLFERPTHGEHMARYWLDLARYADTHGLHLDNERSMWPYRDWVVKAYNENMPFDEFTRWQLAGDLLPNSTREQQIASGFNRCNVSTSEGGSIADEWVYRYAVDRTTTMAEVWMGMTAGCAVCHDHKFDPLSTNEYYSLYAFFHSAADPAMDGNRKDTPPVLKLYRPEDEEQIASLKRELGKVEAELSTAVAALNYVDPALLSGEKTVEESETIWFEDAFPSGSNPQASGNPLKLVSAAEGPVFSGELALQRTGEGVVQDYFSGGAEFVIPAGGTIFVHCYLDPDSPPEAVMIQFHTSGWLHRAIWGAEDKIPFGASGTTQKFHAGELPEAGRWVRLAVKPEKMGLKAGDKVVGYAFTQCGGTVTWDHLGISSRIDKAKDPAWSFTSWKEKNQGKRNNDLPDRLRDLVRGKKPEEWSPADADEIYRFWLENFYANGGDYLGKLKGQKSKLNTQISEVETNVPITMVMADLPQPRQSFVMQRGAYDKPGDPVTRNVPAFLPPLPEKPEGKLYDRLDLANWLVSGQHPLTARVTVNRIWQQFFGTGLVKTSADFGSQGDSPSHPELLDWLAVDFVEHGWDVRRLVRMIVLSETYRQTAACSQDVWERDPENRYLARGPRLRLDAEVLRDQALFVSGLLVKTIGGPGVNPYQPPNIWEPVAFGGSNTRFYKQGTGEDLYRRSLYTFLKRTAPPPFLSTFDAPNREQSCSRRERTNTPLQALQLMNDVQYYEAARQLAVRMIKEGGQQPQDRLQWCWELVTSRKPESQELETVVKLLQENRNRYQSDLESAKLAISYGESKPDAELDPAELAAYTLVANLILNLDEVINKN